MKPLVPHDDARGRVMELYREDWIYPNLKNRQLGWFKARQVLFSASLPGTIRAWHRHTRGQEDWLTVVHGRVKVVWYDQERKRFVDAVLDGVQPHGILVPGYYWHGTQCLGPEPSMSIYVLNRLYDYDNPDEERLPPDHAFDGQSYQWDEP